MPLAAARPPPALPCFARPSLCVVRCHCAWSSLAVSGQAQQLQAKADEQEPPFCSDNVGFDGVVANAAAKTRLDAWLASQLPHVSRARVQSSIRSGLAHVNGQPVNKVSYAVRVGDRVKCAIAAAVPLKAEPEDIPLDIVYEDDHLLVVNKPAQMVTHPAPGNWHGTLVNAIVHHCEVPLETSSFGSFSGEKPSLDVDAEDDFVEGTPFVQPGRFGHSTDPALLVRPGIVHRLDKGTTGLLVIAKDEHAHGHLSEQFKCRTVKRSYVSLTCGLPFPKVGCVDAAIARDVHNRTRMAVVGNPSGGRKARTAVSSYSVIEVLANGGSALVNWKLETGRTHQIRVHAHHIGHPLLGDEVYGGTKGAALAFLLPKVPLSSHETVRQLINQLQRPSLHAATLGFVHPRTDQELNFTCPLPSDFKDIWHQLQNLGLS